MSRFNIEDRIYATIDGKEAPLPEGCQWFAGCDNFANGIRPHPAFAGGGVPICQACDDKLERVQGKCDVIGHDWHPYGACEQEAPDVANP